MNTYGPEFWLEENGLKLEKEWSGDGYYLFHLREKLACYLIIYSLISLIYIWLFTNLSWLYENKVINLVN